MVLFFTQVWLPWKGENPPCLVRDSSFALHKYVFGAAVEVGPEYVAQL